MNFFFSIKHKDLKSKLTIPKFKNNDDMDLDIRLYSLEIKENQWEYKDISYLEDGNFFILNDDNLENDKIFFLKKKSETLINKNYRIDRLYNFSNYTNTDPEFRCNLSIFNKLAFSSYQSEYPFKMIDKTGSILSPIFPLTDEGAEKNYIFLKNIFYLPIKEDFNAYLVSLKNNQVIRRFKVKTNNTNILEIDNNHITKDVYLFTDKYIAIPIFVSIKNNMISMEHTHPPHHYLNYQNKFEIVKKKKDEILKIINQEI